MSTPSSSPRRGSGKAGRAPARAYAGTYVGEMTIKSSWHQHPGVRSNEQLTLGERAADTIRNGMGSWGFVIGALFFLAGWMIGNGNHGFDKYPFILLNLILSCLAALQGSILLIAAKRADQISSELALHDYQTNVEADEVIHAVHQMTKSIHERVVAGTTD